MKAPKLFIIILVLLSFGMATPLVAQVAGGRKKEHRNQRASRGSLFKRNRSGGHADAFARGGNKKGLFARVFKPKRDGSAWVYKKTRPGIKENKEQPHLFSRNRTKNKRYRDGILAQQNKRRANERGTNFVKRRR